MLVKNLLNYSKKKQIEQLEHGKTENEDVCIIISYHQLIQNNDLVLFLIPLSAATCKAALPSCTAVLGTYAREKTIVKIMDSSNTKGKGFT